MVCAQWKAKNVSNSLEIEKLIRSLEEDISFWKEVKEEFKSGTKTSPHGPTLLSLFLSLYILILIHTKISQKFKKITKK